MGNYRMKPNASTAQPEYLLFLATEGEALPDLGSTDRIDCLSLTHWTACRVEIHGGIEIRRDYISGRTAAAFWRLVRRCCGARKNVLVIGHDVEQDLQLLGFSVQLSKNLIQIDQPRTQQVERDITGDAPLKGITFCFSSPPTILRLRFNEHQKFTVLDCQNWFRCGVKRLCDLAEVVYHPRMESRESSGVLSNWMDFRLQAIAGAVLSFFAEIRREDLGMVRHTIASQALGCYRHRFLPAEPICYHDHAAVRCLERRAYFGGRVECFMRGSRNGRHYQLDVNSLFPDAMGRVLCPRRLIYADLERPWTEEPPGCDPGHTIAVVSLNATRHEYPLRIGDTTIYARGRFVTVLAGPELQRADCSGEIERWGPFAVYELAPLFSAYVRYWDEVKRKAAENGDQARREMAKLFLNSLYGKLGQKAIRWEPVHRIHPHGRWCEFWERDPLSLQAVRYLDVGGHVFRQAPCDSRWERFDPSLATGESDLWRWAGEHERAAPMVSAWITSAARCWMDHLRGLVVPDAVLYQGIDSLIMDHYGMNQLRIADVLHPTKLGCLRIVAEAQEVNIYGCHDYEIGTKKVIGGVAAGSTEYRAGLWIEDKHPSLATYFSHPPGSFLNRSRQPSQRQLTCPRGRVNEDGTIEPTVLDEDYRDWTNPWVSAPVPGTYGSCEIKNSLGHTVDSGE